MNSGHEVRNRRPEASAATTWPGIVVAFIVAVQLALPIGLLLTGGGGPARFGWHMYSYAGEVPVKATVHTGDRLEHFELSDIAHLRREMTAEDFAAALCRRIPDATSVSFDGSTAPVFQCHGLVAR